MAAASSPSSSSNSSSCFAFLLLLVILLSSHVDGEPKRIQHKLRVHSLFPTKSCSSSSSSSINKYAASSGGARLRLVHRHGPCSPLRGRRQAVSHEQILREDQALVDSLHRRISAKLADGIRPTAAAAVIPVSTGKKVSSAEYIVTVGFGTPKQDQALVIDTGSDVTWIQCRPCASYCHDQVDALFDPASSSSYSNISCGSAYCSELDVSACSGGRSGACIYGVEYGDGSETVGFYARETLSMGSGEVIPNFRFGCGQDNSGLFDKADGILGLGRAAPSLVSQTRQKYDGVFSYCLPSTQSSTGYLSLGGGSSPSESAAAAVKYTPMLTDSRMPTFYYMNLKGISVAGKLLPVAATVFSKAGTIIDSGTVITRLPPAAYSALRAEFRLAMKGYNYKMAAALSILDTCYDLSGYDEVEVPSVALEFAGGATVEVEASGTFYAASPAQVCLAFAANDDADDVGILGNVQQRTMEVVYDGAKKMIGFASGGCD